MRDALSQFTLDRKSDLSFGSARVHFVTFSRMHLGNVFISLIRQLFILACFKELGNLRKYAISGVIIRYLIAHQPDKSLFTVSLLAF